MVENGPEHSPQKELDPTTRVVVTGIGAVSPLGLNVQETWQNMVAGKTGIKSHVFEQYKQIEAKIAGTVEGFDAKVALADFIEVKDINNALHRSAHFSLAASFEALTQAGLLIKRPTKDWIINRQLVNPHAIATVIGTGVAGAEIIADVQLSLDKGKTARGKDILKMLPERVATSVSMAFGLKGMTFTPVAACATGNTSIAEGFKEIMIGNAEVAIVGGSESCTVPIATTMFDAMRALDKGEDPNVSPRPFDENATGFVMGEGAGILVLERLDVALKRKATILAEIVGIAATCDAYDETAPSGEGARASMLKAIKMAEEKGVKGPIYVNPHATGTPIGDPPEIDALNKVYGRVKKLDVVGISGTKSSTGHLLGAAGGLEAVISISALQDQIMPPTLHLDNPRKEASRWNLVPHESQKAEFTQVHSNAFGFGGLNSTIIFARYQ